MPFPDFVGPQGFQGPTPEETQAGAGAAERMLAPAITEPDEGGFSYQQAPQPRQAPQQGPDPNGFFFGNHPTQPIPPGAPHDDPWTRDQVGQLEQAEQVIKTNDTLSPEQKQTGLANIWKKLMEYDPGKQYRRSSLAGMPPQIEQMMAQNTKQLPDGRLVTYDPKHGFGVHMPHKTAEDKQPDIAQELDHIRKTGTYTTKDADGVPTTHIPSMDDAIKEWQIMHGHRQSVLGHVRGVQGSTSQMGSSPTPTQPSQGLQAPPTDEFAPKPAPHGKTAIHDREHFEKRLLDARTHLATETVDNEGVKHKKLGSVDDAMKLIKEHDQAFQEYSTGKKAPAVEGPVGDKIVKAHEAATEAGDHHAAEALTYIKTYLAKPDSARTPEDRAKFLRAGMKAAPYLPQEKNGSTSINRSSPQVTPASLPPGVAARPTGPLPPEGMPNPASFVPISRGKGVIHKKKETEAPVVNLTYPSPSSPVRAE